MCLLFFFKQKTAYEISTYWSSDVCSSDLIVLDHYRVIHGDVGRALVEISHGISACLHYAGDQAVSLRSEERRVGKECRSRWGPCRYRRTRIERERRSEGSEIQKAGSNIRR